MLRFTKLELFYQHNISDYAALQLILPLFETIPLFFSHNILIGYGKLKDGTASSSGNHVKPAAVTRQICDSEIQRVFRPQSQPNQQYRGLGQLRLQR